MLSAEQEALVEEIRGELVKGPNGKYGGPKGRTLTRDALMDLLNAILPSRG